MSEHGFFLYIKGYYKKRYPNIFERELGTFLFSILKYASKGNEVYWFSTLIDQNCDYPTLAACHRAILHLERKFQVLSSRAEDPYKRLKLDA